MNKKYIIKQSKRGHGKKHSPYIICGHDAVMALHVTWCSCFGCDHPARHRRPCMGRLSPASCQAVTIGPLKPLKYVVIWPHRATFVLWWPCDAIWAIYGLDAWQYGLKRLPYVLPLKLARQVYAIPNAFKATWPYSQEVISGHVDSSGHMNPFGHNRHAPWWPRWWTWRIAHVKPCSVDSGSCRAIEP